MAALLLIAYFGVLGLLALLGLYRVWLTLRALEADRRERGLRLVALKRRYAETGRPFTGGELPDYLPALLEFAALAPAEGEILLNELRTPLELVRTRLYSLGSPYALLLDEVVSELPKPTAAQIAAARRLADEGPPLELVGLEPFPAGANA